MKVDSANYVYQSEFDGPADLTNASFAENATKELQKLFLFNGFTKIFILFDAILEIADDIWALVSLI